MAKFHRYLAPAFLIVVGLVLAVAGAVGLIFYNALPSYSGHVRIACAHAPVDVWRDEHGVPHIFAADMNDAMCALGYVHASERMFQMEMQRRAGQGRLSEVVGKDALGIDKFIRTLGLYALAQRSLLDLSPEAHVLLEHYTGGVNAWMLAHKHDLPAEFALMGFSPEPWRQAEFFGVGQADGTRAEP